MFPCTCQITELEIFLMDNNYSKTFRHTGVFKTFFINHKKYLMFRKTAEMIAVSSMYLFLIFNRTNTPLITTLLKTIVFQAYITYIFCRLGSPEKLHVEFWSSISSMVSIVSALFASSSLMNLMKIYLLEFCSQI